MWITQPIASGGKGVISNDSSVATRLLGRSANRPKSIGDRSPIDLGPYLNTGLTQMVVTGAYSPSSASVSIRLEGPNTMTQQQSEGAGKLNCQLNLMVEWPPPRGHQRLNHFYAFDLSTRVGP